LIHWYCKHPKGLGDQLQGRTGELVDTLSEASEANEAGGGAIDQGLPTPTRVESADATRAKRRLAFIEVGGAELTCMVLHKVIPRHSAAKVMQGIRHIQDVLAGTMRGCRGFEEGYQRLRRRPSSAVGRCSLEMTRL